MTVIAAYDDGKHIWIGSDSAGSDTWSTFDYGSKLIKKHDYYIGFTSSYRTADVIREARNLPKEIKGIKDVRVFRDRLAKLLIKAGGLKDSPNNGELREHPVGLIIISRSGIYNIMSDYQIHKIEEGYYSVGSGYLAALGVLNFAKNLNMKNGEEVIQGAVKAAMSHVVSCGGKCYFKSIKKGK